MLPAPDDSVGEFDATLTPDACITAGTDCGTVDSSAWVDDDLVTSYSLDDEFTGAQTGVLNEFGFGAKLVVACLVVGLGIVVLVKWAKRGVRSA